MLNDCLRSEVRQRVEALSPTLCEEWGGTLTDGVPTVTVPDELSGLYEQQTIVRNTQDGLDAFEHYTDFFEYILDTHEPEHDSVVLLPCGKTKPIGCSAIHTKKLHALEQSGYGSVADIMIISEPCTIVPHDMRLCLPAVNYDFPPEYTDKKTSRDVFEIFTDRLAEWLDSCSYETVYSYLVAGHQRKIDAAMDKASDPPRMVLIPGASYNPETEAYSGDLFKKPEHIAMKLDIIRGLSTGDTAQIEQKYPEPLYNFYRQKFSA